MRIGIDCRLWCETGVGRYIRNLILNLQKLDTKNEYVLFALSKDRERIELQNPRFRVVDTDIKWHTLGEQIKFPRILNQENLDLMHFPYFSIPIFYNRPFIMTIHDLIINHFSTGQASTLPGPIYSFKKLAYKFVVNRSAKKAKKIIAVSNATKDEIVDHLKINNNKISVVYEGVNQQLSVTTHEVATKGKYFLYVGNAYPHKNINRLLKAFKMLGREAKLIFVGREDYFYNKLRDEVGEMTLSLNVAFMQNATDEKLSSLYQNARALILPSLMEGFGLPALEAMANKCLVLASNIPALREICGDAAIYFDPYSVQDIAKKIKEANASDVSCFDEKREKGLVRAKFFSWEKMAKETLEIYESSTSI